MCGHRMSKTINFFFCVPIHNEKLKFMEPSRVRYQVNPAADPPQQFCAPSRKTNSCLGTSQMAPPAGNLMPTTSMVVNVATNVVRDTGLQFTRFT